MTHKILKKCINNKFYNINLNLVKTIIQEFEVGKEFSSHDFIEKFTARFESDYIDMLVKYQKKENGKAFQTVHSVIAKFLTSNMQNLGIKKGKRNRSENIHGVNSEVQWWHKSNNLDDLSNLSKEDSFFC